MLMLLLDLSLIIHINKVIKDIENKKKTVEITNFDTIEKFDKLKNYLKIIIQNIIFFNNTRRL